MKTKHLLLAALTFSTAAVHADVLFESDFDSSLAKTGTPPKLMTHADATASVVSAMNDTSVAKANAPENFAFLLQGGDEASHSWKPAADFSFPNQTSGFLRISFLVRNPSFDIGTAGLQVAEKSADGMSWKVSQSMTIYPTHIKVTGTGRGLFKEITSGIDSNWHKIVWTFPISADAGGTPTLVTDGKDQGKIAFKPKSELGANTVRFWLTSKRTKDIKFVFDDIKIESAPTIDGFQ